MSWGGGAPDFYASSHRISATVALALADDKEMKTRTFDDASLTFRFSLQPKVSHYPAIISDETSPLLA